jgi:hypothetical protein
LINNKWKTFLKYNVVVDFDGFKKGKTGEKINYKINFGASAFSKLK